VLASAVPVLGGCSGADRGATELTVFAAASLTDAFTEVGRAFEGAHDDVEVRFSFGGSSALREQILQGAPADVFASASPDVMDDLVAGAGVQEPRVFATNRLQLAVPAGNPAGVHELADLGREDLLVGLCAAEVPCGAVARDALRAAGVDAAPDTEEADVRALLTKLEARELDAGLVYATDVRSAGGAVEGTDLPAGVDARTSYPIAVVEGAADAQLAADFVAFVLAPQGQAILRSHGFGSP